MKILTSQKFSNSFSTVLGMKFETFKCIAA